MSATGRLAVQTSPSHFCDQVAGVKAAPSRAGDTAAAMMSPVSGNHCKGWPCTLAGRPLMRICRRWPSLLSVAVCPPDGKSAGRRPSACSNAAPLSAEEPRSGRRMAKSPSCGMHSCLHTSQEACRRTSIASAAGPGSNSGVMVSGTGSSTVPS